MDIEKNKTRDQALPRREEAFELPDEIMDGVVGGLNTSAFKDRKTSESVTFYAYGQKITQR